jgi:hypothetical protein
MSGNLKIGADGNLLHGPDGHLVNDCGSGCCIDCPQAGTCVPTQWTITFSDVTMAPECVAANGLAVSTTGSLDGTYTVPDVPGSPQVFWATTTDNVLWEEDAGSECLTTPDQPYRIFFQDAGGTLLVQVDGGSTATDLKLFEGTIPTPSDFPCSSMTFTNSLTTCGSPDGFAFNHGCGGTAVVTAC